MVTAGSSRSAEPPALPPRYVRRQRLLAQLDEAVVRPLTVLAAGAGTGKTSLLSHWAAESRRPVVWISPDVAPDDEPDLGELLAQAVSQAVSRATAQPDTPVVLVLDDAHAVRDTHLWSALRALLRRAPEALRVVIATRSDPPLPLHRYRIGGQLSELRAADLAMTTDEIGALLEAHDVQLADWQIVALAQRTEGWAAGLRLAAMRMQGARRPGDFVTEFALDPGSPGEYLMEEVLAVQSAAARKLLIDTSFLQAVSGDLAATVTGAPDSDQLLQDLAHSNAFVFPLDRQGGWYRYHPLLREILQHLFRAQPQRLQLAAQQRAAHWFLANGRPRSALLHAMGAEDAVLSAHLLVHGGIADHVVARGRRLSKSQATLAKLKLAPPATQHERRELTAARTILAAVNGQPTRWIPVGGLKSDDPALRDIVALSGLLRSTAGADERGIRAAAAQIVRELAPAEDELSHFRIAAHAAALSAGASLWSADEAASQRTLDATVTMAAGAAAPAVEAHCHGLLALLHLELGQLRLAVAHEQRGLALLEEHPRISGVAPLAVHLASAALALEGDDLSACRQALDRAAALGQPSDPWLAERSVLLLVQHALRWGRLDDAQLLLSKVDADLPRPAARRLLDLRVLSSAEIAVRLGRPATALHQLEAASSSPETSVAAGFAHLALGRASTAAEIARRVVMGAARLPALTEAWVLSSAAAQRSGDAAKAAADLERAVRLGAGLTSRFQRGGSAIAEVLAEHRWLAEALPFLHPAGAEYVPHARTAAGVLEELTDRETTIVRLLSSDLSSAQIAAELCISVNTVKTHLSSIYRKLPAANRREAVGRARELELL